MDQTYILTITAQDFPDKGVVASLVGKFVMDNIDPNRRLHVHMWADTIVHTIYRITSDDSRYEGLRRSLEAALLAKMFFANGNYAVVASLRVTIDKPPSALSFMITSRLLTGTRTMKGGTERFDINDGQVQHRVTLIPVPDQPDALNKFLELTHVECPAADCANGYNGDSGQDLCPHCGGRGIVINPDALWEQHKRFVDWHHEMVKRGERI